MTSDRSNRTIDTNSSEDSQPKRARIDPTVASQLDNSTLNAIEQGKQYISSAVESLHPKLGTILVKIGNKHLVTYSGYHAAITNQAKMEKDKEYIPISARSNFRFSKPKAVTQLEKFKELDNETMIIVKEFNQMMRQQILKANKLEIDYMATELQKERAIALCHIIRAFLATAGETSDHLHTMARKLIDDNDSIRSNIGAISKSQFVEIYQTSNQATLPNSDTTGNINATGAQLIPSIFRGFMNTCVSSHDQYRLRQVAIDRNLKLVRLETEIFTTEASATTRMEIDNEPTAEPEVLDSLIKKRNKELENRIQKLEKSLEAVSKSKKREPRNQRSPLNKTGGRQQQGGAPQTKKSDPKKAPNDAAAASNNGTEPDKRKARKPRPSNARSKSKTGGGRRK
jgi:hypothetical protein